MNDIARSLMELAARRLESAEREVVLGDLAQIRASAWRGLIEILGLVIRRQSALWNDWRPWLAAFAVALPSALLLMGVSFSISCTYQRLAGPGVCEHCAPTGQEDLLLLLCHVALLITWSWTVGFAVGSISRRTLWVSAALALVPCVYCLSKFHETSLSRLCLLLFIPPAILGISRGLGTSRIKPGAATALAVMVTVLTFCAWENGALWIANWVLIVPAWYIVIQARNSWRMSSSCS